MKYQAFISYRHSEFSRHRAEALEKALKSYARPLWRRPARLFRDEKYMTPDNDLPALIRSGLEHSAYLLFLAEEASANSPWCQDELHYWCNELGRVDRLIIVYLKDDITFDLQTKTIDWERTNALPGLLQDHFSRIPLYADLSWVTKRTELSLENIRFKSVVNSLTACFRGVTPEEINDEEVRVYRRNRLLQREGVAILAVMLLISLIASFYAFDRQAYAEKQQQIELDSAAVAQFQRGVAKQPAAGRIFPGRT